MKRVSASALENLIARRLIKMGKDKNLLREILEAANSSFKKESKILEERRELPKKSTGSD